MLRSRWRTVLLGLLGVPLLAVSTEQRIAPPPAAPAVPLPPAPPAWPRRTVTPADAVVWAWQDAQRLPVEELPFLRWVWVRDRDEAKELSLCLNYVSHATTPRRPVPAGGQLVRVDLRYFAPQERELQEWLTLWESFQYDPSFSRLITGDTLRLVAREQVPPVANKWKWIPGPVGGAKYVDAQGQTWWGRWEEEAPAVVVVDAAKAVVIRENSHALDGALLTRLQEATGSLAPVVTARYLMPRLLSTVKDDGLFAELYGGLYYDFAGIRKAGKDSGITDLDQFLFDLGVRDVKLEKFYFRKLFDELTSDQRAAVERSEVTGKPRAVVWFSTLATRTGEAASIVFITQDLRRRDIDIGVQPLFNLIDFKPQAYEVIALQKNGLQRFAIFGADGQRLDEAGQDVVSDHDIPKPHTKELQGAISCIRCHGSNDGWQPLHNDARDVLKAGTVDIFDDRGFKGMSQLETLDRLAGLYSGTPELALSRARDDYARAVLRATGPWAGLEAQTAIVSHASRRLAERWYSERLAQIDAAAALTDLGFQVEAGKELEWLKMLLPPDRRADTGLGFVPEDIRIALLKDGKKLNRASWDLVRDFAAERVERRWREIQERNK